MRAISISAAMIAGLPGVFEKIGPSMLGMPQRPVSAMILYIYL